MFSSFDEVSIPVESDVTIYGRTGGSGPPMLLLHGFPQNLLIWHRVAEKLATKWTVIALDLRGYGKSSKPKGDDKHVAYSKTVMARDCVTVMRKLGHVQFHVCAHDRGARVTHRMCVDYPSVVVKAILLDIAPTLAMYSKTNFDFAKAYAHWFFLIKPSPFPEKMILADPTWFAQGHMGARGSQGGIKIFEDECWTSYIAGLADPHGIHGMCEDYRASASIDMDEAKRDIEIGRKIQCPLAVLWSNRGIVGSMFDPLREWKEVSDSTVDGEGVDAGHYIPEEVPEKLMEWIQNFFQNER